MNEIDGAIRTVDEKDKKQWDLVVTHPLQSWAWGEFRASMGIHIVRLGVYQKNTLKEGWQITFHGLPHLPFTIGYFPKGPLPDERMVDELIKLGKQKNAIFVQLEPNIISNFKFQTSNFKFMRPSHHPLFTKYTFVLDITQSKEDLLKAMHPKTRYNIGVAQKHGVVIKEDNSPEAFLHYLRLTNETTSRQGFYAHNDMYQKKMWHTLHKAGIAHLFTATYKDKTLAAWILFSWNDTVYYPYGATSRDHRETMAPNLMLWHTALWAKEKGFKHYDLWGALGPNPDTTDSWHGFHRFKEGYKPKHVEFIGSYDLIINSFLYKLYCIADVLRWKYLSFKKH